MSQRVLVVDDDPTLRRTLRINLRARGYEVEEVGTAHDALTTVADAPPDLVVLDLGCRTSTASRCCGASAPAPASPSSSCRRATSPTTRSRRSTRAPTTTSPSPSGWTS